MNPSENDLAAELIELIIDQMDININAALVNVDTPLFANGLELDSFAVVELITRMEARYGIEFQDSDFREENFESPRTLAGLLKRYLVMD